jgi:PAS domain S-box-containing protein
MLNDITERKLIEEELRNSQRILADIINFLPDATTVIDRQGRVIAWNQVIEAMTGIKAKDMMGKGNYEYAIPFYGIRRPILIDLVLMPQEDVEKGYVQFERRDGILFGEAYMPNMKGGETYLSASAAVLYDHDGNVYGAIESIRDVTDHKRAEEQKRIAEEELKKAHDELELRVKERTAELEARNAEMERFIYTVSHELRSPLISSSGIVGFLRQDLDKGDAKRTETDLRLIEGAMTKMDQLLGEILDLSRIGRVANPPVDVPFGEIVTEALNQEAEKLRSKEVEVSVASDLPNVQVDRMRIVEVLVNLIDNSIRYMGDQPRPRIEIGYRLDENQTVFIVRDNGMGIDPSQHEKVFGLFYKVDGKGEGTGVGLALVKRIIEVHNGRIWIESELDKGCTMCFTLPFGLN